MTDADLSKLPRIDDLVDTADDLVERFGRAATTQALREAVDRARTSLRAGSGPAPTAAALVADAGADLRARRPRPLRRVINATGVVVHTNLGRAPLAAAAVEAMIAAAGPCDLEMDLSTGRRGSRGSRIDPLIAELCGAPDGLAVNNAASALVLTLAAHAHGRGVVVSRGELIEIGGSFRIPDILAASGARLVEVGTTNRTKAADYAAAVESDDVALILKVHPSNYQITGFAESVGVDELAAVAATGGVPLVYDVGSGLPADRDEPWLRDEPSLRGALNAGADLVIASGDKLLGGPQAGLVAGAAGLVGPCRQHPLARAFRLDKLRIAGLAATLDAHLREDARSLPVWRMLMADHEDLRQRAELLARATGGAVVEGAGVVGGGAAPLTRIPGPVVRVAGGHLDAIARRLREGDPPVVGRIEDGALWLDPRTVDPADDEALARLLRAALQVGDRDG